MLGYHISPKPVWFALRTPYNYFGMTTGIFLGLSLSVVTWVSSDLFPSSILLLLTRFSRGESWILDWGCRWSGVRSGVRVGRRVGATGRVFVKHKFFFQDNLSFLWSINITLCRWVDHMKTQVGIVFGGNWTVKILANLLKLVALSEIFVVFYANLSFFSSINIKLCRWVCHIKTQVGIDFGVNWTVKSLPTCKN